MLLSNRSAAALAAGRVRQALPDASAAAAAAPGWCKPQWRRGRALGALGRWPEAAAAFARALRLAAAAAAATGSSSGGAGDNGGAHADAAECEAALAGAVKRLNRQQLADAALLVLLGGAERWIDDTAAAATAATDVPALLAPGSADIGADSRAFLAAALPWAEGGAAAPLALLPPPQRQQQQLLLSQGPVAEAAAGNPAGQVQGQLVPCDDDDSRAVVEATAADVNRGAAAVAVVVDAEGRRLEGGAGRLRWAALREAMFLEVKEGGAAWAQAQLLRWLRPPVAGGAVGGSGGKEAAGPPPRHEAALCRARLAVRLHAWPAAEREARAAVAALARAASDDEALLCRQLVEAHAALGDALLRGKFTPAADGGSGGAVDDCTAGAVDALGAARAYETALELLPLPVTAAGSSGGGGSSSEDRDFAAWAAAARRRLQPRLAAARERLTEADWRQRRRQRAAGGGTDDDDAASEQLTNSGDQGDGSSGASSSNTLVAVPAAHAAGAMTPAAVTADERSLQPPPRLPLALPYARYSLVGAAGAPAERPDKHPFCMARVRYAGDRGGPPTSSTGGGAAGGDGGGVWFQPADGSCRWRQTASEVEVVALRVPPGLPAARLAVDIAPYALRAADAATGEVFLQGALARGVVPASSFWTLGEGDDGDIGGVDGSYGDGESGGGGGSSNGGGGGSSGRRRRLLTITLAKMNLELYERPWQHSAAWWPRLFEAVAGGGGGGGGDEAAADGGGGGGDGTAAAEVAWDDAEHDCRDLPPEVMREEAGSVARDDRSSRQQGGWACVRL